jgi:phage antirepressor YoqD-like protein
VTFGRAWTSAEDAALREHYVASGAAHVAELVGRSTCSVRHRAQVLGLKSRARWTSRDDALLRELWGHAPIGDIATRLGRPEIGVYHRAAHILHLCVGAPQGLELLSHAAARTGYDCTSLRRVLRAAGVEVHRPSRSRIGARGRRFVDTYDVDRAVEAWLATEDVHVAARRHGQLGETVRRWLLDAIASGAKDIPPPPRRSRFRWRVPSAVIDRVVAERTACESVRAAAKRVGVDQATLSGWLVAAGVARRGRFWVLPAGLVDRVVAERRAKLPMHALARRLHVREDRLRAILKANGIGIDRTRRTRWLLDEGEVRRLVEAASGRSAA